MFSTSTDAAGAVNLRSWDVTNHLDTGSTTITATDSGPRLLLRHSYTNSLLSKNSALGYQGRWYTFQNHLDQTDVTITVDGNSKFVPGLTVWATDTEEFDGGTYGYEQTSGPWPFKNAPVSFNATGESGDDGTLWMAFGEGGNVVETLGYAVVGPAGTSKHQPPHTRWGETILHGAHDVSNTDTFEIGVSGSVDSGTNTATLVFDDLAAGWYTVFVGDTSGKNSSLFGQSSYELTVSAVPEAETWAMLLAGLGLIGWRLRNQPREAFNAVPA
ncbi:MAG: PEP-CTERM sorting domain-containing protein [Burkholderiales bacterium]|nr:PEP-CTERM sorting domain-containing protein [Nitrosomonas sp.]MCP5273375.1 PEP-CTERM sorting domain-containing protein [Burkholderiales bacterium]